MVNRWIEMKLNGVGVDVGEWVWSCGRQFSKQPTCIKEGACPTVGESDWATESDVSERWGSANAALAAGILGCLRPHLST